MYISNKNNTKSLYYVLYGKIAPTIKLIRQKKNLKQEYVAFKLGTSCASYANIENNRVEISIKHLAQLAFIFEMQVSEIVKMAEEFLLS